MIAAEVLCVPLDKILAFIQTIFDAVGVRLRDLPMTAEKVLQGLGRL